MPVGAPIRDITLSPDGTAAYVLAHHPHGAAAVIRIDLVRRAIGAVVEVGESATQVVMSLDGPEIYVVDRDGIAVLSALSERVFESITVDARPSCVAMSSGVGLALRRRPRGRRDSAAGRHAGASFQGSGRPDPDGSRR